MPNFSSRADLSARLTLMGWEDLSIQREWLDKVGRELGVRKVHFRNSYFYFHQNQANNAKMQRHLTGITCRERTCY